MSRFLSPTLAAVTPYTPGEQPQDQQYIKLNTNESPYLPSPRVVAAVSEAEVESIRQEMERKERKAMELANQTADIIFPGEQQPESFRTAPMELERSQKRYAYHAESPATSRI